jgi:hypothetical protein
MRDRADLHAIALDLARASKLSDRDLDARLDRARDAKYWESLSPSIHIGKLHAIEDVEVDQAAQSRYHRFFNEEKYFETPVLIAPSALAHVNAVIDAVMAAGWPAEFALVDDAFWLCARIPALRALVEARLGQGYRQIPHLWLHVVRKVDGAGGWPPHFDGFRTNRISVWLALTDATTTNGCMFVVPPKSLPESFRTFKMETLATTDVMRAMHATRALPVRAGASLGWDFDVFHWGGRAVQPGLERRALSMEFLGASESPEEDEVPIIDVDAPLPSLDLRLKVIAIGLDTYSKREPLAARFRSLTDDLLKLG